MRKLITSLVILQLGYLAVAQPKAFVDSLKNDLSFVTDDSLKFRLLDELAWTYRHIHVDSALEYSNLSIEVARKQKNELFLSIAYTTLGVVKLDNDTLDFGVSDFKKSLALGQRIGNPRRIAPNLNNLGNAYKTLGKYDSAIIYLTESIKIKMEMGTEESAAGTMSNLGLVYMEIENAEKALEYFKQAVEIVGENNRRSNGFFNNMGIAYSKLGDSDSARFYLKKAIANLNPDGNERQFSQTYNNIAESFEDDEMYDSALHYSLKSYYLKKEFNSDLSLTYSAITLSKIYGVLGNYEEAKKYASEALEIAQKYNSPERVGEATWALGLTEERQGNFEQAAENYRAYIHIREELTREEIIKAAEDAERKFQTELKEKENRLLREEAALQKQKIKTQTVLIWASVGTAFLLLIIAYIARRRSLERKKLVDKIESQAQKLHELDRAKTRFFANISHDLRTPLSLILGAFDNIQSREEQVLDKESREELDTGYKNAKRLLFMADEIMDLTRLEDGKLKIKPQYVKLVLYLQLLTKMFHSAADLKGIRLSFSSEVDSDLLLELDPYQFEKIIYNLLSNAIKHTEKDGTIEVKIKETKKEIEIEIKDTGAGIPSESLPHVFDRFYQSISNSYSSKEGIGIGLALVKEIVDAHKGSISVQSELGVGTSFFVHFPYDPNKWVSDATIPQPSTKLISKNSLWMDLQEEAKGIQIAGVDSNPDGKTILIVEDHKEVRALIKSILHKQFRIITAANGTEALALLAQQKIDLILTDLMMPLMDGFELIDKLKSSRAYRKIPVIIISARNSLEEKVEMLDMGVEDVMSKPFDKDELVAKINNLLGKKDWDTNKNLKLTTDQLSELEKEILKKVENLVLARIDDPNLSVMDISNELAASERKVYRLIKRIAGITPYELIKEVRWQYIFKLLTEENIHTATEAASLIGMSNPSDFSQQFEKRFGQPLSDLLSRN